MTREHFQEQLLRLDGQLVEMGELVAGTISRCARVLETMDAGAAQDIVEADSTIDGKRYEIETQAVLLIATQQPLASDLREVVAILTIASELERIGDYCEGIAKLTLRMAAEPVRGPLPDIGAMAGATENLLRAVLLAFQNRDIAAAGNVWAEDDVVDDLYAQTFRKQLLEMAANHAYIRQGTYTLWIAHNFERMADRVTNIAERVAYVVTGDIGSFREKLLAERPPV